MANLPKRSVRVLSVDFNFINKTALNSLVYQHPLVELNLVSRMLLGAKDMAIDRG